MAHSPAYNLQITWLSPGSEQILRIPEWMEVGRGGGCGESLGSEPLQHSPGTFWALRVWTDPEDLFTQALYTIVEFMEYLRSMWAFEKFS